MLIQETGTYYDFNELGLRNRMSQESSNGEVLLNDSFTHDEHGNITEIVHLDGTKVWYTYDLSNRLTKEQYVDVASTITSEISYTYDVRGNRKTMTKGSTTTNYDHDKANQLISIDGVSLAYDANGNMTSDGTNGYTYNAENQLTTVKNASGTTIANYEYNHNGQRFKKVTGDKTKYYYYNAGHLAYITDELNNVRYSFTRNGAGQLLTMTDHTGASAVNYFYVLNLHGDVLGLRDGNGNMVVSYSYDSFGNILTSTGTATTQDGTSLLREANPFRYASYFYYI
jgi:YD repeat-containing protein